MQTAKIPIIDPKLTLPELLKALRTAQGRAISDLAEKTDLSRITVSAAEGKTDARLSSVVALFDALGYTLLPVPKHLARETASFINNGGVSVSLPAGQAAPLGVGQRAFQSGPDDDAAGGEN